jgi:hypothetical protein
MSNHDKRAEAEKEAEQRAEQLLEEGLTPEEAAKKMYLEEDCNPGYIAKALHISMKKFGEWKAERDNAESEKNMEETDEQVETDEEESDETPKKSEPPKTPGLDSVVGPPPKKPQITPDEAYSAWQYWQEWFKQAVPRAPFMPSAKPETSLDPEEQLKRFNEARESAKKFLEQAGFKVVLSGTPTSLEEAKKIVEGGGYKLVEAGKPTTIDEAARLLEDMGYKIMDGRITLEEAEKRVVEERAKWEQDIDLEKEKSLEESKIGAATQVVTHAIDRVMEPFTYFLTRWFEGTIEGRARAEILPTPPESSNPGPSNIPTPTVEPAGDELTRGSFVRYTHTGKKSSEKVEAELEEEG